MPDGLLLALLEEVVTVSLNPRPGYQSVESLILPVLLRAPIF